MKKIFLKVFWIATCISSLSAGATYSLAFVNMDMDYTEYDDHGEILDSERSSSIYGFEMEYGFALACEDEDCSDLKFNALVLQGKTEYIGSLLGSGQPYGSVVSKTTNQLYDLSLDWTQMKQIDSFHIRYGVGIGYHVWYRELSSTQNELYHWFYLTPIIALSTEVFKGVSVETEVKYKHGLSPKMEANTIADEFQLGKADTLEVNIPITYHYSDEVDFFVSYVYSRQMIDKSNEIIIGTYRYWEPDSTTNDNYFKLGITFNY
jgi:hypothetical protein